MKPTGVPDLILGALQQRGTLTVWVTPEALEVWEDRAKRSASGLLGFVIETAVMLRLAMGRPW